MKTKLYISALFLCSVLSSYGQWESANLSETKAQMGVASLGSKVYFAGGVSQATGIKDLIGIYDVKTGEWSYANLSVGRIVPVGVTCGSKVFFAGGGIAQTMTFFDQELTVNLPAGVYLLSLNAGEISQRELITIK